MSEFNNVLFDFSGFEPGTGQGSKITAGEVESHVERLIKKAETSHSPVRTLEELLKREETEQPKLLEPLLLQTGLAGIIGSSDTGKSCFARQLCLHIIEGKQQFLNFKLNPKHNQAVYVTTEDDESSTTFAYKRMLSQNTCINAAGLRVIFDQDNLEKELNKLLTEQPADIVVIDAYADIAPVDSNQATPTRQLLHRYRSLANRHETLFLFVHHTGKAARNTAPSKHGAVGSQSWEAKLRTVIELRSDVQDPNKKHLCVVKGNNVSQDYKNSSFLLEFDEQTLSFFSTGERIPFEELAPNAGNVEGGCRGFDASQIPKERHEEWLGAAFGEKGELRRSELVQALKDASGKGSNAIEDSGGLITYYLKTGLLIKEGRGTYSQPAPF